jgi:hypothetical protein
MRIIRTIVSFVKSAFKSVSRRSVYLSAVIITALMSLSAPTIIFAGDIDLGLPEPGGGIVGQIMQFIFGWMWIVGVVVSGLGAIQLAISVTNKDADAKASAIKIIVAGAIVTAVGVAVSALDIWD